ncbi:MAG: ATP-binding protein [bacterium]|nr:ATP-binding protein [bacterium]
MEIEIIAITLGVAGIMLLVGIYFSTKRNERLSYQLNNAKRQHAHAIEHLARAMFRLDVTNDTHNHFASLARTSVIRPIYDVHTRIARILRGEHGRITKNTQQVISQISATALHSARAMDRFLYASDIETHRHSLDKTAVEIKILTRDIIDTLDDELLSDTEIILREPEGYVTIFADHDAVRNVLSELIDNALTHSHASTVIVSIETSGGNVVITIVDNGQGMTPEVQNNATKRFYTTQRNSIKHTGLGLYYATVIAKAHGGDLSIKGRAPMRGTHVCLRLPTPEI